MVEHKSRGRSLDDAYKQAVGYFAGLKNNELPRYVLVSDFARFRLYDLEEADGPQGRIAHEFLLADLHVKEFGFMLGFQKRTYQEQDPVNIKAAQMKGSLADLYDPLAHHAPVPGKSPSGPRPRRRFVLPFSGIFERSPAHRVSF